MTTSPTFSIRNMKFQMLRASNYLKVARRVIESVAVNMVNMLIRIQLPVKESFHDNPVLRLIMAIAGHNVSIAILDVFASENPSANGFTIATHQSVVIGTKTFSQSGQLAAINAAYRRFMTVGFLGNKRIAVFIPALVMFIAQGATLNRDGIRAVFYRAFFIHDAIVSTIGNDTRSFHVCQ